MPAARRDLLRLIPIPLVFAGFAACSGVDQTPPPAGHAGGGSTSQGGGAAAGGGVGGFDGFDGGPGGSGPKPFPSPPSIVISANAASMGEFETSLVIAPSGLLAASWTEESKSGPFPVGYAFSADGGATWTSPAKLTSPIGSAADSVLGADAKSNVYLAFLGHSGNASGVFASRAAAPATVLGAPVEITDPAAKGSYDKPWMVRLANGQVLVTYQEMATDGTIAGVAATTTDGVIWTRVDIARDGKFRNLFYPCVSDTGRVWVVYYTQGGISMRHSDDNGATWSLTDDPVSAPDETTVAFAEPECAASGDEVWISYGLSHDPDADVTGKDPKLYAIRLARAYADKGVTIRTDADLPAAAKFFMKPQITNGNGRLQLTYYAGDAESDANGSFLAKLHLCVPRLTLHAPVVFEPDRANARWPGDYSGLAAAGGDVFATFIDNASGAAHVAFVRTKTPSSICGGP